jgi:hypothetical protein
MGTKDQYATHRIMGAGHPRLRFELEAFTANQPAHYDVDDDYRERKGRIEGSNLWLTGQIEAAKRYLSLVRTRLAETDGTFPELALYDCHGCHHGMDDRRWSRQNVGPNIDPGTPRLQNQHFLMLEAVTRVLEPAAAGQLRGAVAAFVRSGQQGTNAVAAASDGLLAWIGERERRWSTGAYERAQVQGFRSQILRMAAAGQLADYASAEQAFLALESLTLYLGASGRQRAGLDELFATVEKDETYRPARFADVAGRIAADF